MRYASKKDIFLATYGTYDHIKNLIGKNAVIDEKIAANPEIHKDFSEHLLKNGSRIAKTILAENTPHIEHLNELSNYIDPFIRHGILYNHHASPNHLKNVVDKNKSEGNYEDEWGNTLLHHSRLIVVHPNASKEMLENIAAYPTDKSVQFIAPAKEALKRLNLGNYK